jgi:hypothetical protein
VEHHTVRLIIQRGLKTGIGLIHPYERDNQQRDAGALAALWLNDFSYLSVFQQTYSIRKHVHRQVMRGDQDGSLLTIDDLAKEFHDLLARRRIEFARRFVGEDECGLCDERTRCCCPMKYSTSSSTGTLKIVNTSVNVRAAAL